VATVVGVVVAGWLLSRTHFCARLL
jgi:hypothetical protein